MKEEIGVSAAVLAIMIAGALRADAHDETGRGQKAYEKARGLDAFEVEVERQGTKLVLEYEVR